MLERAARILLKRRARPPRLILAATGLWAVSCMTAAPLPETVALPPADGPFVARFPREVLAPDDLLQIVVLGHPELSTADDRGVRVDATGRIHLPLAGTVDVGGLTVEQARGRIEEAFERWLRHPSVGLSLVEPAPRQFYVVGDVEEPGPYDLDRPMTALQALSFGGAFRPGADREDVALLRVEEDLLVVHLFDAATPDAAAMVPVVPGDVIFVRQTGAGTFREQILPILQGFSIPAATLASISLAAENLERE